MQRRTPTSGRGAAASPGRYDRCGDAELSSELSSTIDFIDFVEKSNGNGSSSSLAEADLEDDDGNSIVHLPYGQSILPTLFRLDPTPRRVQILCFFQTVTSLAMLPFLPGLLSEHGAKHGIYTLWDDDHGVDVISQGWVGGAMEVLYNTMDLEAKLIRRVLYWCLVPYLILASVDSLNWWFAALDYWMNRDPNAIGDCAGVVVATFEGGEPASEASKTTAASTSGTRGGTLPSRFKSCRRIVKFLVCRLKSFVAKIVHKRRIYWPSFLRTENTQCYHEMFSEPTLQTSFVKRPGNTYSNLPYLHGSILILYSNFRFPHQFTPSDTLFGIMLLTLSIFSTIWHSSNAPKSQYVDIWSMDNCIIYLILRIACVALRYVLPALLPRMWDGTPDLLCSRICTVSYSLLLLTSARAYYTKSQRGTLDGGCPFSGRYWLSSKAGMTFPYVCFFASLPVFYMMVPFLIQIVVLRHGGSLVASTLASGSLVFGWTVRMWERWCLDGYKPMNWIKSLQHRVGNAMMSEPSLSLPPGGWLTGNKVPLRAVILRIISGILTVMAAFLSPTAILHFWTGITLLMGYGFVRSLDGGLPRV